MVNHSIGGPVVLVSKSPRWRDLISKLGIPVRYCESQLREDDPREDEMAESYVLRMAKYKVDGVSNLARTSIGLIGSDTVVVNGKNILRKPTDPRDAMDMLKDLRGKLHRIVTGINVKVGPSGHHLSRVMSTKVVMRNYSTDEIRRYVSTGDPLDKAGGYGIQNARFRPVRDIEGCYTGAMGLPLCSLVQMLKVTTSILFDKSDLENIERYSCQYRNCRIASYKEPVS